MQYTLTSLICLVELLCAEDWPKEDVVKCLPGYVIFMGIGMSYPLLSRSLSFDFTLWAEGRYLVYLSCVRGIRGRDGAFAIGDLC